MKSTPEKDQAVAASTAATADASRPPLLLLATAALGLEAVGLCVVIVANLIDLAGGRVYQRANAIEIIVIEVIVAVGVAWFASAVARVRPWSRTPAVMTQVLTLIVAVILLQAGRSAWGAPALLVAIGGLAGLFAPASLRALNRRD